MKSRRRQDTLKRIVALVFCVAFACLLKTSAARTAPQTTPAAVDFKKDIEPIFSSRCYTCHSGDKAQGELRLDTKAGILKGGASGAAVVAGKGRESLLVKRILGEGDGMRMPPTGDPLTKEEIGRIVAWIDRGAAWPAEESGAAIDFVRDVQPIFQASCYACHSGAQARSGLRLDSKPSALKGGISGQVIKPGDAAASRLMHRVRGHGDEPQMPMGGEPLQAAQIAVLERWINQGAAWPDSASVAGEMEKHWAFVKPVRPAAPVVKRAGWARNAIDSFVLARLEKENLQPSPEAAKETLLRRISLDLTGLPPTPAEVDQFLADSGADAYEKLVDRLLASPHYGERWGRHWLDAARYADTNGFEKDDTRQIWPYRDWVIDAVNRDLPFDQFTVEQLAGDLLPNPTLEQKVATGFLRNSMLNEEGGVDPEQFRVEGLIDRVDAVGKAFLGLTVNCAQCHTHKFDPIPHKDYYKFYAFLNSDEEPELEVPGAEVTKKRAEIMKEVARVEDELMAQDAELPQRMAAWEERVRNERTNWTVLEDTEISAAFGTKFERLDDASYIARGDRVAEGTYTVKARTALKNITGVRLETLTDHSLTRGGPGRSKDGMFYLTEFAVEAGPLNQPERQQKVTLGDASASYAHPDHPVKNAVDGDNTTKWGIDAGPGRRNQDRQAVFVAQNPINFDGGALLTIRLFQRNGMSSGLNIGRFRLAVTADKEPRADPLPARVRRALDVPAAQRTGEQQREIFSFYRTVDARFEAANHKIDELMKDWPYGPTTLALARRARPRETHIFRRGDWRKPGDAVTPGVLSALHPLPAGAPANRLGLARWIIDPENPLTARVIVNRIWQQYFGQGLVVTADDFGARSERPSHPELLDWLAVEFRERGWSMKHIHRLIVTSATYRQSSRVTPQLLEADPYNRWLARAPRLRVEAETVRDIALAAGGLLNLKIGGPSVFPPIPDGVLSLGYGAPMKWETSTGADRYRRAMYTFWKRSVPYPSLLVFDAPNADFSCTRRIRSNTPLQALTTLNDQLFMEAAQGLALRVWREGGADDRARLNYAFRLCLNRAPDQFELGQMQKLLDEQRRYFAGRTAAAVYVSAPDLNKLPEDVDLHQLAPWAMVARVLLNLDETITKE